MTERFRQTTRLADLITSELRGDISDAEREELKRWKNESSENIRLYEKYKSEEFLIRKLEFIRRNDINQAYLEFTDRINVTRHKRRKLLFYRYAGIATLLFLIGGGIYLKREEHKLSQPPVQEIKAGYSKAILTQPDGTKVDISDTTFLAYVKINSGKPSPGKSIDKPVRHNLTDYRTITIPRGGEYALTLSDGSRLKMNSESEIQIPESFGENSREIYMNGEIYFDIVRDTSRPFIVHTTQGKIKVLGTSFNIRNYSDEIFLETTLVSGKVTFNKQGENTCLEPGKQLRLNKTTGETTIQNVDIRSYCAWKDGWFVFEKQRLENIMNTISRWYNIQVFYQDQQAKDILFTGNIKRYNDLSQIVNMLTLTNKIDIEIKGTHIFIKSNL